MALARKADNPLVTAGLGSSLGSRIRLSRPSPDRGAKEQGFTLVEMLITVAILGVVAVAMFGAIFTSVKASDLANRRTIAETELRRYAEYVRAANYSPCAAVSSYPNTTSGTPYTKGNASVTSATVQSVRYWTTSGDSGFVPNNFASTCPTSDQGLQQLTLQVTVGSSPSIQLSTTIVKRAT